MTLTDLEHRLDHAGVATLDAGARISAQEARRLALSLTQPTCRAEHCTTPAAMCQVDHAIPWAQGGPTDLTNARLLCGPHHRQLTHPHLRHETTPEGRIRYHRRE